MYMKEDFIDANEELINNHVMGIVEVIEPKLRDYGYFKGDFTFKVKAGVFLGIIEEAKKTFAAHNWILIVSSLEGNLSKPDSSITANFSVK